MPAVSEAKYLVTAGWSDVPHLDEDTKRKMLASTPAHLRKARSQGVPSLGAGAIYPYEEEVLKVEPFAVPRHWRRSYGMDVGWNRTAVIWSAHDLDQDVVYLYAEYYRGQAEPAVHASAIKARGVWIPGAIDPASNGRSQKDGERLYAIYKAQGLDIHKAENSVEAGILAVQDRINEGRLKVFSTCSNWWAEYRLYRRNENGLIVKKFDHLMDATRYDIVSGLKRARVQPVQHMNSGVRVVADGIGGY